MHGNGKRPKIVVSDDGSGVVSHSGSRLLADLADRSGLTGGLSDALSVLRERRGGHDPGRVLVDLAVMLANGGTTISDLAVLRHQPALFGAVASTATAWRVLDAIDEQQLGAIRVARAAARERVWLQAADTGRLPLSTTAGGIDWPGLRLQLDATLTASHSDKEGAAANFKGGYGFHTLTAWCDNTDEALDLLLRAGNAGANTAADHIAVTDRALAQIPDAYRHGTPILICADGAGATKAWLAHLRRLREQKDLDLRFSVGFTMSPVVQQAILVLPDIAWTQAIEADGSIREGGDVAELTGCLPELTAAGWPAGMRVLVRRERPHPGAQLTFAESSGWRYQTFATDTDAGQLAHLEARHRAHARVEDRIRCAKSTGLNHLPSRQLNVNTVWVELVGLACDLLAWTRMLLLDGALAVAEPKLLRYRLLHVAARLTRSARRLRLRIDRNWPWKQALLDAFTKLAAFPMPIT